MLKVKKSYLLLMMIAIGFAKLSGGNLPYSICYCVIILFIISIIYTLVIKANIGVNIRADKSSIVTGEVDEVILAVHNESLFPISYMEVQSELFHAVLSKYRGDMVNVGMKSHRAIRKKLVFNIRGVYRSSKIECKMRDILGIFSWTKVYNSWQEIKVYPKIYTLKNINIGGANVKNYNTKVSSKFNVIGEDSQTVKNIREYRVGDNYKHINWKVTAKHNKIFVKEYENNESPRVNLFLDFRKDGFKADKTGEMEEVLVEFFLSLVNYLVTTNRNATANILSPSGESFYISGRTEIEALKEYFVEHFSEGEGKLEGYMDKFISNMASESGVILLTNDLNTENLQYVYGLSSSGYKVKLFYLKSHIGEESESMEEAIRRGVECLNIEEIR